MKSSTSLLIGHDKFVADWLFHHANWRPIMYNTAIGVVNSNKRLVAGFLFCGYNGHNVDLHFYGPGELTRGLGVEIFIFALRMLNVDRLTIRSRVPEICRGVRKLGAIHEATMRRVFGPTDDDINAAEQFVFFREKMEELAGIKEKA